jgi:hypothetical protein
MEYYDVDIAKATLPAILRLGRLMAPYGKPLYAHQPADGERKWRDLALERGISLSEDGRVGTQMKVLRRDLVPGLGVKATLDILGEAAFMMPETPHGQQVGHSHIVFPQDVGNEMRLAMNANYRMFTTGYAEVGLMVDSMPDVSIREYIKYVWGRLALDQVVELPDNEEAVLGEFQIGSGQIKAIAEYMEELRRIPR